MVLQQGAVVRSRAVETDLVADVFFGLGALGLILTGDDENWREEGYIVDATPSRKYETECIGWTCMPSAASPATWHMRGLTPAT
jgi:hypothetical protein